MSLRDHIVRRILADGPMRLSEYMSACLMHPEFGYYATHDPFGAEGDFITAPEISQMFGELLGLALAQCWLDQGAPAPFALAELGPGRGTLMADMLRATRQVDGFHDAMEICLVETSPALRAKQAATLEGFVPLWFDRASDLPQMPLFGIANEFFDALPIRQFTRDGDGWCETLVGLEGETLTFGRGPRTQYSILEHRLTDTRDGDIVETCPEATLHARALGTRIAEHGGAAIIVDYGDWRSLGDTFQALKDHAPADPLENPGAADLTAHVDFEVIAGASPTAHSLLTPQGVLLERLGITRRAERLADGQAGPALDALIAAHRRLTHPQEMGTLFKALALYPAATAPPPGFEPAKRTA